MTSRPRYPRMSRNFRPRCPAQHCKKYRERFWRPPSDSSTLPEGTATGGHSSGPDGEKPGGYLRAAAEPGILWTATAPLLPSTRPELRNLTAHREEDHNVYP